MPILNRHGSYISLKFINFCIKNQIVTLCLLFYITHIFQLLDVRIFEPFIQTYKILIERNCQYETSWLVNKTNFLQHYIEAREKIILHKNILSAWTATGLILYNPKLVMVKKSLVTSQMKSLSFTSPIPSNSMHYFSFSSQILLSTISIISPSENSSHYKAESTFSQSSYLQNFKEINIIVQRFKDRTPCQNLCIEQLTQRAKLEIS